MAALMNGRHEAFAQAIAAGETGLSAYKRIYKGNAKTAKKSAYLLRRREDIVARIQELHHFPRETVNLSDAERRRLIAHYIRRGAEESAADVGNKIKLLALDARLAGELQPKPGDAKTKLTPLEKSLHALIFGEQPQPVSKKK
jgi:hypothetical protein